MTKLKENLPHTYCKCAPDFKRILKHEDKYTVNSLQSSVQEVDLSALYQEIQDVKRQGRSGELLVAGPDFSSVAPFIQCESLHGAFAQSLDVFQETGRGQNVRRPWNQRNININSHQLDLIRTKEMIPAQSGSTNDSEKVQSKFCKMKTFICSEKEVI